MESGERRLVKMSRVILGVDEGIQVDHANRETLRNLHSNLRQATQPQNRRNSCSGLHTSKYKGVSWHSSANKWHAQIAFNKVKYSLGFSDEEIVAARLYDEAALRLHGEFARINGV
jgi:hypothetical protein